jgi:hypothetical protein
MEIGIDESFFDPTSSSTKSPVIILLENIGVTNLTGQVAITSRHPSFEGAYSNVYQGTHKDKLVCSILISKYLSLSDNLGRRQGNKNHGFRGNHGQGARSHAIGFSCANDFHRKIAERSGSGGVFGILIYCLILAS